MEWSSTKPGNWVAYRVYRRTDEQPSWQRLTHITTNVSSYLFRDWLAPANMVCEWAVVRVTDESGNLVESAKDPIHAAIPNSDHYWLIHPQNSSLTVLLNNVESEEVEDEEEKETMHLIGRGRKVDLGDFLGVKGSLSATIRDRVFPDGRSGREQLRKIKSLKESQSLVYLRNPFGDVWPVKLGAISFTRESGVGVREFGSLTIPYEEVIT